MFDQRSYLIDQCFHSLKVGYKLSLLNQFLRIHFRFHSLKVGYKHVSWHKKINDEKNVFIP